MGVAPDRGVTNATNPILIVYATRYGHTRDIAEHVAGTIRAHGRPVVSRNVREPSSLDLSGCAGAILAASVYVGHHERAMIDFVRRRRAELEPLPTAFLSVSMSAATAEDAGQSLEQRARAARDVARVMTGFFQKTGWRPDRAIPVAGALEYTRYNLIIRWIMKRIARKAGASTDTSRDHVYTDWEALDRFATEFIAELGEPAPARV